MNTEARFILKNYYFFFKYSYYSNNYGLNGVSLNVYIRNKVGRPKAKAKAKLNERKRGRHGKADKTQVIV